MCHSEYETYSARHRGLLSQYLDPPRGASDRADIEHRLSHVEDWLARNPPQYKNEKGVWLPRGKGLITADEARARATPEGLKQLEEFEMPKAPRIRDDFGVIPVREWPDMIQQKKQEEATNRGFVKWLWDQRSSGACTSYGMSHNVSATQNKQGNDDLEELNPQGLYRKVNGGRDGGSSLSDNIAAASKYGIPSRRTYDAAYWRTPLTDDAKQDALRNRLDEFWRVSDKEELGTASLMGMVVLAGYPGHAWMFVDLIDTKRGVWGNSWGRDWGDDGFSTIELSRIAWYYGLWATRTVLRPTPLAHYANAV